MTEYIEIYLNGNHVEYGTDKVGPEDMARENGLNYMGIDFGWMSRKIS